jgi:hypothetical protein
MALPVPVLDDKTFAELVDEAKKLIPRFAPGWTDYNLHDPGITLIDLLAWLTEMQQYRLDQIRDRDYLKFLKLLGIRPDDASPARVDVTLAPGHAGGTGTVLVPAGAPLAAGEIPFETEQPLMVTRALLKRIITSTGSVMTDNTEANGPGGLAHLPFGADAEAGSRLYLGLDRPLVDQGGAGGTGTGAGDVIALTFKLADYPGAPAASPGDEPPCVTPSLAWEYCQKAGSGAPDDPLEAVWAPLEQAGTDETLMLTRSGRFYFTAPTDMGLLKIPPYGVWKPAGKNEQDEQGLYWLRATVSEAGYELPPQLDWILLNTVPAMQRRTLAEVSLFSGTGEQRQAFLLSTYLSRWGEPLVQVGVGDGYWNDLDSGDYLLDDGRQQLIVNFGETPPEESGDTRSAIRLISFSRLPGLGDRFWLLGRSNGLPDQEFSLDHTPVCAETLLLQVQERDSRWRDWVRVDDFDASGPGDPHFTLDAAAGTIRFGDGVNGDIPPAPADGAAENIRLVSYACGGGEDGNVKVGAISGIVNPGPHPLEAGTRSLSAVNLFPAAGGRSGETLDAAKIRARSELGTPSRAVTTADFEYLALNTPGLMVARAKAVVVADTPEAPVRVRVVVAPYSRQPRPVPSPGFLETVHRHLDRHRLITTEIEPPSAPDYVQVDIYAQVAVSRGFSPRQTQQDVISGLIAFLAPLAPGGPAGDGWPFGRDVYESEIYAVIARVPGVSSVDGVQITKAKEIEAHSLVYSGTHTVEIVDSGQECSVKG